MRRHVADGHCEHGAGEQQVPESRDFAHDLRREVEAERRPDDPLPAVAHRCGDAEVDAGDAQEREREQRARASTESACAATRTHSPRRRR